MSMDFYKIETRNERGRWRYTDNRKSRKAAVELATNLHAEGADTRIVGERETMDGEDVWNQRIWENGEWIDNDHRWPYDSENYEYPPMPPFSKLDMLGPLVILAVIVGTILFCYFIG
jgi:hypothetical protein